MYQKTKTSTLSSNKTTAQHSTVQHGKHTRGMSHTPLLTLLLLEHQHEPRFRKLPDVARAPLPPGFIPLLKEQLRRVAIGQPHYSQLTKRSLLHLYSDILAPNFTLDTLDELILRYVTIMKKEQKLLGDETLPLEDFLNFLKRILKQLKGSELCLKKLQTFYGDENLASYKVSEIKDIQILTQLYSLDLVSLQKEIDAMRKPSMANWYGNLQTIKEQLLKNTYSVTPDSFDSPDVYFRWRAAEIQEIDSLIKGNAQQGDVIPQNPAQVFEDLIRRVFTNYTFKHCSHLITKCVKYWRIGKNTKCTLIHKVANETILNTDNYDASASESVFALCSDVDVLWMKQDREQFKLNWDCSSEKLMIALRSQIQDIFTFPKFSPLLQIYYTYVRSTSPKWIKRLKNILLSTTEKKYIEFLQVVPRDSSLSFEHIEEVSKKIYDMIKSLEKKYPKPLLDKIYIARECGAMFMKFFGEDASNMLKHISHYSLNKEVDCVAALDTYAELQHLRDIHDQISSNETTFPINLEKQFFQYFDEFTDGIQGKFIPITERAIQTDDFKPLDSDHKKMYSSSTLDVHKMINEMWSLVKKYHWKNDIQLAYVYTKLLRGVSESINLYCTRLLSMVERDLSETQDNILNVNEQRKSSMWFLKNDVPVPSPYNFKLETCVILDDLFELLNQLTELEQTVKPEDVQRILHDTFENIEQKGGSNVFTIRVLDAENIKSSDESADAYITIMNTSTREEIGKTKVVNKSSNPHYDQIFELQTMDDVTLSFSLWDKSSHRVALIGRTLISLDQTKFNPNGEPVSMVKDFDVQGSLKLEISLECEQNDAIFYMGKSHRTISRSIDMVISKIVEKFSVFITHCLSRQTLKECSGSEIETVNDAISPLFDYLNANLQTLAMNLTPELLIKVMIQAWGVVLDTLDNLVLPPLSSAKSSLTSGGKWSLNMLNKNIPGYGKVLSSEEVRFIRMWLESLSEFFHNEGQGPPMTVLHNSHFNKLSQIVEYYDMDPLKLQNLVDEWTPACINAIKQRNFMVDDPLKRSGTIVAFGTKRGRQMSQVLTKASQLDLEDVVLRVLLCRDERKFVLRRLKERERVMQSVATERLAKMAMRRR